MTTLQAAKDPVLRGVSPTPSKIPVRSQRRPPLPTVKPCALDQENQDPKRLVQKLSLDSAGPGPKVTHQTEKSERSVGSTQLRNPLEELRPSPGGQNVGPTCPPQTEAPGTIEFVADPAALATILSGEGVKSCRLGRQPSLAQRVLIRGSQGGTIRRGQGSNASHPIPSPGRVVPPSITHPSPFGRAQRVPSPSPSAPASYSVLRRLAMRPKTQFTPILSAPRVQQAQGVRSLSPQSCPEEPALPWEQIAVRLFDQESCIRVQDGPGKAPVATPHPGTTPRLQELKMQRINILQQLLREEVEGLTGDKCAPLNGGSSLDMAELQPLLAEISGTPSAPEQNSGALHLPRLSQCSELPEPCLPAEGGEAQPCPPAEPGPPESSPRREPGIPEPCAQEQPEVSEPCPPVEPGCLKADSHRQAGLLEPSRRIEPGASEAGSLEPKSVESSPQPCRSPWAPATTTLIFSSQRPLCANPPIHSLQSQRPPTGQAGPSNLAPRTLALRQRLKACLTAIHSFHEACLDDECAFYTSRAPPLGPTRVCTNPVATLLEWQDALMGSCFCSPPPRTHGHHQMPGLPFCSQLRVSKAVPQHPRSREGPTSAPSRVGFHRRAL
ncbi:tastin isoform X4 [Ailuropoda melanoleuca]|uniref:tastin isoform X4 n=1 Tax=Ailuropoda melanoleuca TaxID=9646 RepID=UPI00149481D2|nr:tastin isoform X4 [Ailuropoda melanoleuca]